MKLPRSHNFGLNGNGSVLNSVSLYRASTDHASELSFDVSNNQLSASLTGEGEVRRACICSGIEALPPEKIKGGVYSTKKLLYAGRWRLTVDSAAALQASPEVAVSLVENVLPLFTRNFGDLRIHQCFLAPVDRGNPALSPRGLIQLVVFENNSDRPRDLAIRFGVAAAESAAAVDGHQDHDSLDLENLTVSAPLPLALSAMIQFTDSGELVRSSSAAVQIPGHTIRVLSAALLLSENHSEETQTIVKLSSRPISAWFEDTLDARRTALGQLSIPECTIAAESVGRFCELSRQTALRTSDGRIAGGFLGSDVDSNQVNWPRDAYYSMLAMSLFNPALCADAIPYFLQWAKPTQTTGPGRSRFPGATTVSQSLSNSVSGLSLAGAYYRATGDRPFFISKPEILAQARKIFDEVLHSRRGEVMLFPSMYFSDGEARGDFHTGSNIAVWFAFSGMAQVAAEAYHDERLADEWATMAQTIKEAVNNHCVGDSSLGKRFFEGANTDGSKIAGHDGEESETTLMPFYGFCRADDQRILNHATLAMTSENPYYSSELDAIWWYNSSWRSATFPGWTTALAGARDERQIKERITRILSLTDVDGSLWWWPYPYGSNDRSTPLRGDIARKCGWGAAVYLCRFVNDILGISVDARSRSITFSPFVPWDAFEWRGARVGATNFDFEYRRNEHKVLLTLTNRFDHGYKATVDLIPRDGAAFQDVRCTGASMYEQSHMGLWGRESLRIVTRLEAGQSVEVMGLLQ